MKLFFDTEFTGLRQNTTLISIGIVSEDGRIFYAEFTDYDAGQCNDWIRENVLSNLFLPRIGGFNIAEGEKYLVSGSRKSVVPHLKIWLEQFDSIQFVSDICHYDFVLLVDLLTNGGTALDLPENISAVCHDINQDIATHFYISDREAFDMSREQIMNALCGTEDIVSGEKHNSLYDARIIREIWKEIGK